MSYIKSYDNVCEFGPRFLDVDKKSSVTVLMSPMAARSRPWDQQQWKPCSLEPWNRVEPADDRIGP